MQGGVKRIEFIPVEWRIDLKLNEESLQTITPKGAPCTATRMHGITGM